MKNVASSIRMLVRQPRYTVLAVFTLAAGIGVNSAMFGLLDAVYFRPLPLADPATLVEVTLVSPGNRFSTLSYEEFRDIERGVPAFADVMAIGRRGVTLNRNGEAQLLLIHYVSGRYFPSLGIPMELGRGFTSADDRVRRDNPQVVINHHVWKEQLGAPPDIIGRTIQLNNTHFTVIGVTARGFVGLERIVRTDVWVTTAQAPLVVPGFRDELADRSHRWFSVIGRLEERRRGPPGSRRVGPAAREMARQRVRCGVRLSGRAGWSRRAGARPDRKQTNQGAGVLALVGLVLLIACANVANLTLARSEARQPRDVGARRTRGDPFRSAFARCSWRARWSQPRALQWPC